MITRRGLIGFALSLVGWRPKAIEPTPVAPRCPWDARSEELHALDPMNHYCDYEAFEEWWREQTCRNTFIADKLDGFDLMDNIAIYSLIGNLFRPGDFPTPKPNHAAELERIARRLDIIEQEIAAGPFAPTQLAEALARETRRLASMLEADHA